MSRGLMELMEIMPVLVLAIVTCYLVAWAMTTQIAADAARKKGYGELSGKLWFIGLFGSIIAPPIIAAALPDKNAQTHPGIEAADHDELPTI